MRCIIPQHYVYLLVCLFQMKVEIKVLLSILVTCTSCSARQWGPKEHLNPVQAHSGLTVVNPPQLKPLSRISRRGGPLPGYLPLRPVSSARHPRWFQAETALYPTYLRPPTDYQRHTPVSNHRDGHDFPKSRKLKPQRQSRKECNSCNSVPWTPIFKSPRELVPHIETVYPDSTIQQSSIVLPDALSTHLSHPTVFEQPQHLELVGLPFGNVPVAPDILLPPSPPVPFPEVNAYPTAPIHDSIPFKTDGHLLPPRESSNVIVTISEPEQHAHHNYDQAIESSSLVNAHIPHQHQQFPQNNGLDIVKSVPLAEYTSSIEYPLRFVQSAPYIDINTNTQQTTPNLAERPYEKLPATGSQKVSDFILGVSKAGDLNKNISVDSASAGSDNVQSLSSDKVAEPSSKYKTTRLENDSEQNLQPPPLPPHLTQLVPTYHTAYLHPLLSEKEKGVASDINGALLPPAPAQPMNQNFNPSNLTVPPKKVQIIIPYTTINHQAIDQNALGSVVTHNYSPFQTLPSIIVTEPPNNQPRRVPTTASNFLTSDKEAQFSQAKPVQHIFAGNIKDLLKKEMEPKQNIRLQKNIDNWTALEYSNHKITGKKQAGDVISQAKSVTSPGTSISHLLLQSKKIPAGYLLTTPSPNFDDPTPTPYSSVSLSSNSQPFTTVSRYSTVAWNGPTSTPRENQVIENGFSPSTNWSQLRTSITPSTNEKVYVVTPESSWGSSRRSTRHIDSTEKYTPQESQNAVSTTEKSTVAIEKPQVSKKEKLQPKSTPLFKVKTNQTRLDKISKFMKPKPIATFFATTVKPAEYFHSTTKQEISTTIQPTTIKVSQDSTPLAAFPFRNGGELPLEMSQVNFSSSELVFKNTGDRKTLIKQVKINNRRPSGDEVAIVTPKSSKYYYCFFLKLSST